MFGHRSHNINIDYLAYPLVVRKALRRQNERFKLYAPAKMLINGVEQDEVTLRDVSCRGIRLTTTAALKVKDEVEIRIDEPTVIKPVAIKCKVIWCTSKPVNLFEAGLESPDIDLDNFKEKIIAHAEIGITTAGRSIRKKFNIDIIGVIIGLTVAGLIIAGALRVPVIREYLGKKALIIQKTVGYHLEGVVYDPGGKSIVTINDRVVAEGETYKNLRVDKINKDSVEVSLGSIRRVITFNKQE